MDVTIFVKIMHLPRTDSNDLLTTWFGLVRVGSCIGFNLVKLYKV